MNVDRLIEHLRRFNGDAKIRVHTAGAQDLDILSIYSKTSPNNPTFPIPPTEFVEIDVGGGIQGAYGTLIR